MLIWVKQELQDGSKLKIEKENIDWCQKKGLDLKNQVQIKDTMAKDG